MDDGGEVFASIHPACLWSGVFPLLYSPYHLDSKGVLWIVYHHMYGMDIIDNLLLDLIRPCYFLHRGGRRFEVLFRPHKSPDFEGFWLYLGQMWGRNLTCPFMPGSPSGL